MPAPADPQRHLICLERKPLLECRQLKIIRIDGSLFFGAVNETSTQLRQLKEKEPTLSHILIIADSINFIDIAGAEMLVQAEIFKNLNHHQCQTCERSIFLECQNFKSE